MADEGRRNEGIEDQNIDRKQDDDVVGRADEETDRGADEVDEFEDAEDDEEDLEA